MTWQGNRNVPNTEAWNMFQERSEHGPGGAPLAAALPLELSTLLAVSLVSCLPPNSSGDKPVPSTGWPRDRDENVVA